MCTYIEADGGGEKGGGGFFVLIIIYKQEEEQEKETRTQKILIGWANGFPLSIFSHLQ